MSKAPMSGRALDSWKNPGYGYHAHSSETDRPDICRGRAKAKAYYKGLSHKMSRRLDKDAVLAETEQWLASLSGADAAEARAVVDDFWAGYAVEEIWDSLEVLGGRRYEDQLVAAMQLLEEGHDLYAGTVDEGLTEGMSGLGYATVVTLEEANTCGLRVTNTPSGYTYGRS